MSLVDQINNLAGAVRDKLNLMTPRLLPAGGASGQVLAKASATDYAAGWVDPAGGGAAPLGMLDYWDEAVFAQTGATGVGPFQGTAISGGTRVASVAADGPLGIYGLTLRSHATTANSGYRYMTGGLAADAFGGGLTRKFECVFTWLQGYCRIGFLDSTGTGEVTDGAYIAFANPFEGVFVHTVNNGVATGTFEMNVAAQTPGTYHLSIEADAEATEVTFRLSDAITGDLIFTRTHTANIPTATNRAFGAGLSVFSVSGTLSLVVLHRMGIGTIAGYQRARG
jgi:hypothetical protein